MSDGRESVSAPVLGKTNKWWFQDAGLRRLYFLLLVAIMSSATNGMSKRTMNAITLNKVETLLNGCRLRWVGVLRNDMEYHSNRYRSLMNGLQSLTYWQECESYV